MAKNLIIQSYSITSFLSSYFRKTRKKTRNKTYEKNAYIKGLYKRFEVF